MQYIQSYFGSRKLGGDYAAIRFKNAARTPKERGRITRKFKHGNTDEDDPKGPEYSPPRFSSRRVMYRFW